MNTGEKLQDPCALTFFPCNGRSFQKPLPCQRSMCSKNLYLFSFLRFCGGLLTATTDFFFCSFKKKNTFSGSQLTAATVVSFSLFFFKKKGLQWRSVIFFYLLIKRLVVVVLRPPLQIFYFYFCLNAFSGGLCQYRFFISLSFLNPLVAVKQPLQIFYFFFLFESLSVETASVEFFYFSFFICFKEWRESRVTFNLNMQWWFLYHQCELFFRKPILFLKFYVYSNGH